MVANIRIATLEAGQIPIQRVVRSTDNVVIVLPVEAVSAFRRGRRVWTSQRMLLPLSSEPRYHLGPIHY